ncbi:MAG: ribosome maturation factor RimM [Armatimonadota bacterium]
MAREPRPPTDTLVVAAIVGAHGIRGEVKLRPLTEFPERLTKAPELRLRFPNGEEARYRRLGTRWHQQQLLARLEGVDNRSDAQALVGAEVVIDVSEAQPLPEGRYYHHQLLGLRVVTPDGEELGRVRNIIEGASNDVYVAGRYMVPATHDAVLRIDPEEGVIVVRSREYLEGEEVR